MTFVKRRDMNEDKISTKCDVCGNDIFVDRFGNGDECIRCGWKQTEESFEHPNTAGIRNIPSLNNAIKQYKKGKSAILAVFDDFISALESYGELEFTYHGVRFGVMFDDDSHKIMLLNISNNQKQFYSNTHDFAQNASIDGIKLKTLWKEVTNTDFLQATD